MKIQDIPNSNPKEFYVEILKVQKLKGLQLWVNKYLRIFEYNTSKMNVPNKIFSEIKLKPKIKINGLKTKDFLWKVTENNYSSHIQIKIQNLDKIDLTLESQQLHLIIKIISKKYNFLFYEYSTNVKVVDLLKTHTKLKAFNLI